MAAPLQSVTVLAPAKLNLSLDVVGLLPGGYHALDMVMQAVDLYEQVILRRSSQLTLRAPGSRVPLNEKNTAYKAALAFFPLHRPFGRGGHHPAQEHPPSGRGWGAARPTRPPSWLG